MHELKENRIATTSNCCTFIHGYHVSLNLGQQNRLTKIITRCTKFYFHTHNEYTYGAKRASLNNLSTKLTSNGTQNN